MTYALPAPLPSLRLSACAAVPAVADVAADASNALLLPMVSMMTPTHLRRRAKEEVSGGDDRRRRAKEEVSGGDDRREEMTLWVRGTTHADEVDALKFVTDFVLYCVFLQMRWMR